ncbi:hypothetical protein [Noviherbaspirillum sedimenti]|uniref:Type II secretion system protein n=1 Tax=Noviherbaspirillum sedimenti TaxID=2320865 RepID=A0A3A3G365_9BURK|nr:hypothetical protein [Noviherbaspirillum sedimenti]RJG01259.1 hypothetical protein D3878_06395 [Noviherbaspirillum sedimenti]
MRQCTNKRVRGFSRLELATAIALIGIASAILLNKVFYYQEMTEKAVMEYTVISLKSSLRMRMASMMIEGRVQDFGLLAQDNPMHWLEKMPPNYQGELPALAPDRTRPGNWYFDTVSRTLVYQVRHGDHFREDASGQKRIRLQVRLVQNAAETQQSKDAKPLLANVVLVLLEPYRWF